MYSNSLQVSRKAKNNLPKVKIKELNPIVAVNYRQWIPVDSTVGIMNGVIQQVMDYLSIVAWQVYILENSGDFELILEDRKPLCVYSQAVRPYSLKAGELLQKAALSEEPVMFDPHLSINRITSIKEVVIPLHYCLIPLRIDTEPIGVLVLETEKNTLSDEAIYWANWTGNELARVIRQEGIQYADAGLVETIAALSRTVDVRDTSTGGHCFKVALLSERLAKQLGCSFAEVQNIRRAALLHDVGKIGVPDAILHKPGPLTPEEWEVLKLHPVTGANILREINGLEEVAEIVLSHHEKMDGSGYPRNLMGESIPFGGRILAVVDAYGAMTDDRIYRQAISHECAIEELKKYSGTHFDPKIVDAFISQFQ